MLTIQYPNHPNTDTAFVVQDDGTKNRALMTAPQDTSTLELPKNANSCKGYVTINGKKQRVVMTVDATGGSGGSVDYSKTVQKTATMPTADASNVGQVYLYTGNTDSNYTQNYIYKNVKTATYTGTVSFEAATLSGTTVACSGDDFANFLTESGVEPLSVVSGTMTYDTASSLWVLVGKNANNETVLTFQEYQQDFVDAGFTFTGTPEDGDVIAFTCTVQEASATYAWTRIDVQPAGATYTAGTGISINNNEISVTDPVLVNKTTSNGSLQILGRDQTAVGCVCIGENARSKQSGCVAIGNNSFIDGNTLVGFNVALGSAAQIYGANQTFIGAQTNDTYNSNAQYCIGIGTFARTSGAVKGAIQIGRGTNSESGTVYIGQTTDGTNFTNTKLLDSDGTVPTARLTKVNTTITLTAAGWSNGSQTVSVSGITATGVVFVSPDPTDQADYTDAGILCTTQATDSLTFTCDTTPSSDISVVVVQM